MEEAFTLGLRVQETRLDGVICGRMDPRQWIIQIDPGMSEPQRYCALQHEIIHAKHFREGMNIGDTKEERLTRKETAVALIDIAEARQIEEIFPGDLFNQSRELHVTREVLKDYYEYLAGLPKYARIDRASA